MHSLWSRSDLEKKTGENNRDTKGEWEEMAHFGTAWVSILLYDFRVSFLLCCIISEDLEQSFRNVYLYTTVKKFVKRSVKSYWKKSLT